MTVLVCAVAAALAVPTAARLRADQGRSTDIWVLVRRAMGGGELWRHTISDGWHVHSRLWSEIPELPGDKPAPSGFPPYKTRYLHQAVLSPDESVLACSVVETRGSRVLFFSAKSGAQLDEWHLTGGAHNWAFDIRWSGPATVRAVLKQLAEGRSDELRWALTQYRIPGGPPRRLSLARRVESASPEIRSYASRSKRAFARMRKVKLGHPMVRSYTELGWGRGCGTGAVDGRGRLAVARWLLGDIGMVDLVLDGATIVGLVSSEPNPRRLHFVGDLLVIEYAGGAEEHIDVWRTGPFERLARLTGGFLVDR